MIITIDNFSGTKGYDIDLKRLNQKESLIGKYLETIC